MTFVPQKTRCLASKSKEPEEIHGIHVVSPAGPESLKRKRSILQTAMRVVKNGGASIMTLSTPCSRHGLPLRFVLLRALSRSPSIPALGRVEGCGQQIGGSEWQSSDPPIT